MDSQLDALLRPHLRYLPADRPLEDDAPLHDLGLTSMQAIDLLFDIEDVYGVSLDDDQLTDATFASPQSLRQAIDQAQSRGLKV
ncbi:phosphopantetheine-binding protein [Streptomyces sp. TRM 70351]|uniref:phosphopantetheine-binding protein n=1 Tax=Streptomyces sp. TRM 70351 TaxID=3116552 RepID=UPI002E7C271C|nr:phosphopantetheine-binding protein [Streptomyces sp. TRM 70351]MEE1927855.1 phosphopantetheine-binding protein [Streptomyces sp. TRM 70351]